jgi:hypothetical protein
MLRLSLAPIATSAMLLLALSPALRAQAPTSWVHSDGTTHWYELVEVPAGITWQKALEGAAAKGGYLATITSQAENDEVFKLVDKSSVWQLGASSGVLEGPWLGGVQGATTQEPSGGWGWTQNELLGFSNWASNEPDNGGNADRMHFIGSATARSGQWGDAPAQSKMLGYVIEYSGASVPQMNGLMMRVPGESYDGYTLVAPTRSLVTFLIDPRGRLVNWWPSQYLAGIVAYLKPSGHLLRTGTTGNPVFNIGGNGGVVQEFDWKGNLVWEFTHSSNKYCLHHDIEQLPNGNILMIAWEAYTAAEAIANGRDPNLLPDGVLFPDKIIEVAPTGPRSGQIVWSWHAWDHLIQDFDPSKANYGKVSDHPERIDINYVAYNGRDDWMHSNAIDYNPYLDQIVLSVRSFDEIWIIDHSTTAAEARTGQGGRSGMGGRLLYRYGNPAAYKRGTPQDRKLFKQHDSHWIPRGLPGGDNIMIFNNGSDRPSPQYSSVDEITPPTPDPVTGRYPMDANGVWGPQQLTWTYEAPNKPDFYSRFVSGAQRQPNGNTLICAGWVGDIFEVTPQGKMVWRYENPIEATKILTQGDENTNPAVFRAYRYWDDFSGFANKTLQSQDPVEVYKEALLVDGSRVDQTVEIGQTAEFSVISRDEPDQYYLLASSFTPGLLPLQHRFLGLGFDALLNLSLSGAVPGVFGNYFGKLDANGRATASLSVPNQAWLKGLSFHSAFMVFDPAAPLGISTISNTVRVHVAD